MIAEKVPEDKYKVIAEIFETIPPFISELTNLYVDRLHVEDVGTLTIDGQIKKEYSHYSPETQIIHIDINKDDDEYAETFRHEYGHFIDDMIGRVSMSDNFNYAIEADYYWLNNSKDEGMKNMIDMLNDLSSTDAIHSRYISDILSGIFLNDTKIRAAYNSQGIAFYGHDTSEYWLSFPKEEKIVSKETFANFYALYLKNERVDVEFVERWFPNTTKRFKKELENVVYEQ